MRPSWAEAKVLESAGIPPAEATEDDIILARAGLEMFYYIDRAAAWLVMYLDAPLQWDQYH